MRVLHFYRTAIPDSMGGVEQVIHTLASGSVKRGAKVDVLSLSKHPVPAMLTSEGYTQHRVKLNFEIASTGVSFESIHKLAKLANEADLIHYHFPWPFMDVAHFVARVKKPTMITYHSDIIRQQYLLKLYRSMKHMFLSDIDRIVATSQNYLSTSKVLQRYGHKTSVIPIGLNSEKYSSASEERIQYWNKRIGSRFFLFVGVIRYYKGLHILIDSAQNADYPIVIVGSGPLEAEIKSQATRLGLNNIYFLGFLPEEDKIALLKLCFALVFPSHLRSEAFGVSLLEGAIFGKPLISSEIGTGTTYINIDGDTGIVVPPGDSMSLRKAMNYLWDNPEIAEQMGKRAQHRYWEYFTADTMVDRYMKLYDEMIG